MERFKSVLKEFITEGSPITKTPVKYHAKLKEYSQDENITFEQLIRNAHEKEHTSVIDNDTSMLLKMAADIKGDEPNQIKYAFMSYVDAFYNYLLMSDKFVKTREKLKEESILISYRTQYRGRSKNPSQREIDSFVSLHPEQVSMGHYQSTLRDIIYTVFAKVREGLLTPRNFVELASILDEFSFDPYL